MQDCVVSFVFGGCDIVAPINRGVSTCKSYNVIRIKRGSSAVNRGDRCSSPPTAFF